MRSSANDPAPGRRDGLPPPAGIGLREWQGLSPFQRAVYGALCRVPAGRVTTYAALAHAVGCRSPRAVGQALRRNPFAPVVPCHRVIRSDLSLGGFGGCPSGPETARKAALLRAEGVLFSRDGRLADPGRIAILQEG